MSQLAPDEFQIPEDDDAAKTAPSNYKFGKKGTGNLKSNDSTSPTENTPKVSGLSLPRSLVNNTGKALIPSQPAPLALTENKSIKSPPISPQITGEAPKFANATPAERFHIITRQLGLVPSLEQPLVLGITSSVRGEGRTTVALGLATAISQQTPLPVLLVEADIAQPALALEMEFINKGLCEYLRGELRIDRAIEQNALNDLSIMFAGEANGQSLQTLRSARLDDLFNQLSHTFAVVIVDLPPLAVTAEVSRLITQVDQVLMVVQAGVTPASLARSALQLVPEEKRTGVVLNRTRPAFGPFHWLNRLLHKVV